MMMSSFSPIDCYDYFQGLGLSETQQKTVLLSFLLIIIMVIISWLLLL